jgi:hypothetical protein
MIKIYDINSDQFERYKKEYMWVDMATGDLLTYEKGLSSGRDIRPTDLLRSTNDSYTSAKNISEFGFVQGKDDINQFIESAPTTVESTPVQPVPISDSISLRGADDLKNSWSASDKSLATNYFVDLRTGKLVKSDPSGGAIGTSKDPDEMKKDKNYALTSIDVKENPDLKDQLLGDVVDNYDYSQMNQLRESAGITIPDQQQSSGAVTSGTGEVVVPNNAPAAPEATALTLYRANAENKSGAFGFNVPETTNVGDAKKLITSGVFHYEDIMRLKQRLWAAGFWAGGGTAGETAIKEDGPPNNPSVDDPAFVSAWSKLIDTTVKANENISDPSQIKSLDDILVDSINRNKQFILDSTRSQYNYGSAIATLNSEAQSRLGRDWTKDELDTILAATASDKAGMEWDANSKNSNMVIHGGGPDSTALGFGREIAKLFGLTITQDYTPSKSNAPDPLFSQGLGMTVTGTPEQMLQLHEWARTQQGNSGVFKDVHANYEHDKNNPNSITLTFNDGAVRPIINSTGIAIANGNKADDLTNFLEALKRPGGWTAYSWGNNASARGAYGLSDEIWNVYSQRLGIKSNDVTPLAQDRVARAYVQDLYSGSGPNHNLRNWADVALAIRGNEDLARNRNEARAAAGLGKFNDTTTPYDLSLEANQIVTKMGDIKPNGVVLNNDVYASLFGNSGNDLPGTNNPFAGRPDTPADFSAEAMYNANTIYSSKFAAQDFIKSWLSMMSKYDLSQFGGPTNA